VPRWPDSSARQGCSSSRSTAWIDGHAGPTASRIRWTPIRLPGLRCHAVLGARMSWLATARESAAAESRVHGHNPF
jgi:hypothetical protein